MNTKQQNSSVPRVTQSLAGQGSWETMARELARQNSRLLDHIEKLTKLIDDLTPNERVRK